MLQFQLWLNENTISQILKNQNVEEISTKVLQSLRQFAWTRQLSNEQINPLVKMITYWLSLMEKTITKEQDRKNFIEALVERFTMQFTNGCQDYLVTMLTQQPNIVRSKFNNPDYKPHDLQNDSVKWHEQLAKKKRRSADPGRKVEIANMPNGYSWVSLDRASCDKEADAMGHCGNSAYHDGDNIWSMRDSRNIPYLTFIVNDKILGESKGVANNKPDKKYHPQIVALLLGKDNGQDIIEYIKGGGYAPENNFKLEDLDPEVRKKLLEQKPQLANYLEYVKVQANGDPQKYLKLMGNTFNYQFKSIDQEKQLLVVEKFSDLYALIDWLSINTSSDEFPDLDSMSDNWDFNISQSEAISTFNDSASDKNDKLLDQIIDLMKKSHEEDEDTEFDVEWAADNNDEVRNALIWSAEDGLRIGAENDAYQHVLKSLKNETDDNGFHITATPGGGYIMTIDFKSLNKLYPAEDDWHSPDEEFTKHIKFEFSEPYNGYADFDDDAYNDRLTEMLEEILEKLEK